MYLADTVETCLAEKKTVLRIGWEDDQGRRRCSVALRLTIDTGSDVPDRCHPVSSRLNNFPFPPVPNGCRFTILWEFVACQLPGSPSCLCKGAASWLKAGRSSGVAGRSSGKPRACKGTEKKISQPRMNTDETRIKSRTASPTNKSRRLSKNSTSKSISPRYQTT